MNRMMEDAELIAKYKAGESESAFEQLVRRHAGLVYATAYRQCGNAALAEDVSQAVFIALARKARALPKQVCLPAWLHTAARLAALNAMRKEARHNERNRKVSAMIDDQTASNNKPEWSEALPYLDEALSELNDADRSVVWMRFYEKRKFQDISNRLGIGEDAAKKRAARAVERLRTIFADKGIPVSSAALTAGLASALTQTAPSALAASILTAAQTSHAVAQGAANGAFHFFTWGKSAATLAAGLLSVGMATQVAEYSEWNRHSAELQSAEHRVEGTLDNYRKAATEELKKRQNENARLESETREVYTLRAEKNRLLNALREGRRELEELQSEEVTVEEPEELRKAKAYRRLYEGQRMLIEYPLAEEEKARYNEMIQRFKNIGLGLRIHATEHQDNFPETIQEITPYFSDDQEEVHAIIQNTERYEYLRFTKPETEPMLPVFMMKAPDHRGINVVVTADGSAQIIREALP